MSTKLKRAVLSVPIAYILTLIESWLIFGFFLPDIGDVFSFNALRFSVFLAYWVLCFVLLSLIQLIKTRVHRKKIYYSNRVPQNTSEDPFAEIENIERNPEKYKKYFLKREFMNGGEIEFYFLYMWKLEQQRLERFSAGGIFCAYL